MSTITTIQSTDLITDSRTVINTNFSNLNTDKIETSVLDTDTSLAANSDLKVATQKAVKAYVDGSSLGNASTTVRGVVEIATNAEVAAGTANGSSGALLVVPTTYMANRAKVCASKSATQALTGGASATQITFDTEDIDVGSNFASNTFTAPRTGTYLVSFMISLDAITSAASEDCWAEVRKNGTIHLRSAQVSGSSADAGEGIHITIVSLVSLAETDTLTAYAGVNGANATLLATTNVKFSILEV